MNCNKLGKEIKRKYKPPIFFWNKLSFKICIFCLEGKLFEKVKSRTNWSELEINFQFQTFWMVITEQYLHMDKLPAEKHTQWRGSSTTPTSRVSSRELWTTFSTTSIPWRRILNSISKFPILRFTLIRLEIFLIVSIFLIDYKKLLNIFNLKTGWNNNTESL